MSFFMVETTGLEPVTPCMSSKYSDQLSYASKTLYIIAHLKADVKRNRSILKKILKKSKLYIDKSELLMYNIIVI